ncbi:DUF523 and DUF1722 domain-containing protein [Salinivibrio sp. YCSC6]|uniref:YbgA family protein n=1 Tax=Salinivibrio sp. YCSC6 TaxID=2003370 RepID=UPI000BBCDFB8|nr:DUF523 and DUF1722 domain-containing protein [Salinivibrio sp. YCSC6]PCE65582.1 hypothetical protein B6G00_16615 [Salinivibrio sp. YCSC6]QCF37386.1 DUF1722 domain-containing protein [Salinivibrio sp. YCSC6]
MSFPVGVSACVIGEKVRFDSGHKRSPFVTKELAPYVNFVPVCPEVAIGLPVPRPTIRLLDKGNVGNIRLVETKDASKDHTERMVAFSERKADELAHKALRGYIVCAKSPTCGMERVKVYRENGYTSDISGVGLYTQALMDRMPWLPIEEDGRLNDPILRENFVFRLFALDDLYRSVESGVTRKALVAFHSRYKLVLMAHSPERYRELGRFMANIAEYDIDDFFHQYRTQFMQSLAIRATRKKHTNVLMHLQGYFKNNLDKSQKAELTHLIHAYRQGTMPLLAPLTLIAHHLHNHPDDYLASQAYLKPYPDALRLRYGL